MSAGISEPMRSTVNAYLKANGYKGQLIEDDTLPDEHRNMVSTLRERAQRKIEEVTENDTLKPKIHFDFVEDARFNAVATSNGSDYFILINDRVVLEVAGVFRNLFSLRQFAEHIGEPLRESDFAMRAVRIEARNANIIDRLPRPPRIPNCPARTLIASIFAQEALNFLLLHELGHIRNGHLPFLFRGAGSLAEADSDVFASAPEDALAKHTLEMDADSHAVVHGINDVLSLTGSTWAAVERKPLERLHTTTDGSLYAYLLPAYALFCCFSKRAWSAETIWTRSHPPPAVRQYMLPALAHAHLLRRKQQPITPERAFEIAQEVVIEVERGFSLLTGFIPDLKGFGLAAKHWPSYGRALTEYWVEAYPHLDALKLGGLLAPPERWRDEPLSPTP